MRHLTMPTVPANKIPGTGAAFVDSAIKNWNPGLSPRAEAERSGEHSISILSAIGEDYYEGVTGKRVAAALRNIGDNPVTVYVNSPGGSVFEGLTIYSLLREHKQPVTIKILGLAASAASIIAMAGDEIQMMRSSFLMIHNTWVFAAGDRNAFREVADWLQPFDEALADIYVARSGIAKEEILKMLDKETWLGGSASIKRGFADGYLESDEVEASIQNAATLSPQAAKRKAELYMARGDAPRSMRRELLAALNSGMPSAADADMPGAVPEPSAAAQALAMLNSSKT